MDDKLQDRFFAEPNIAGQFWEPWLGLWRTSSLLFVEPWDNAFRAFAARAQLLPRRMAALGLDSDKLARIHAAKVSELVERCMACENPEQCEWDLRQDPANPRWQHYCPNAATLLGLADAGGFNKADVKPTQKAGARLRRVPDHREAQ